MENSTLAFEDFGKIYRLSREISITEKIDGTNGQINIVDILNLGGEKFEFPEELRPYVIATKDDMAMFVGSRNRYISIAGDNFGFAKWATENKDELFKLGYGRHFGEWWGSGIQRGYGLKEKRFSLLNPARWADDRDKEKFPSERPSCCHVIPVIGHSISFNTEYVQNVLDDLKNNGSKAAPGFMKPEGIVIFHHPSRTLFKKTIEKDEEPKGKNAKSE